MPDGSPRALVLTQGDPDGVGPELLLQVAATGTLRPEDVVVADPDKLRVLAASLPTVWAAPGWRALAPLLDPEVAGGLTQMAALARGVDLVLAQPGRALVTAPIDKKSANAEGLGHPGHTEYLAARAGTPHVAMLMAGPRLRVALATIHVALRAVPDALTESRICGVGGLLAHWLADQRGLASPRIGVLGLNPHAGERGMLGDEETRIVAPAIAALREACAFASFEGPLAADSAFFAHAEGAYDALVAMYHDQALAPFKLVHFRDGVNVTLGLPFVRTSPDHGTARDIAGRGIAEPGSLAAAIAIARGRLR